MKRFLLLMPVMIQPYILLFALYSIFINQYIVERFSAVMGFGCYL